MEIGIKPVINAESRIYESGIQMLCFASLIAVTILIQDV